MRHAKSSWAVPGLNDIERPLNDRGKKSAPFMGKLLRKRDEIPELIISSTAKRAYNTAKKIAEEVGYPEKSIFTEEKLYMAGTKEFLSIIKNTQDSINKLMLISHNPAITDFANFIFGENIDNIPTAGLVRVDLDIKSWKEVIGTKGKLIFFEYPKKYPDQVGI